MLWRLFTGFCQLDGPGPLLAGIDFEKASAVITACQTIGDAANGELLVARAHKGLPHPLPAVLVIDRVDVVISRDEIALSMFSQVRDDRFHQPSVVQPSASL